MFNNTIKIIPAEYEDAENISLIVKTVGLQNIKTPPENQKQSWLEWASKKETIQERLNNNAVTTLIAINEGTPTGTGYIKLSEGKAYIGAIYIMPEHQKQQIGTAILSQLLSTVELNSSIEAQISQENIPSKKLFTKHGFQYSSASPSQFFTPTIWELWVK